ncbi:trypsin-like peptidase domain-containing protein [Bradyrhizobium diazoefficiens]|nr:serine protease [Bradyrhizobium diazoefficiens]MBR0852509.1 trypsin-like peptidase domain-containing protein [Bradyrhizobium diazoefficiens]
MALEDSLVAILDSTGEVPVGAGIVVAPKLVLTCAHVVNRALGRHKEAKGRPSSGLKLRFHMPEAIVVPARVEGSDDAWSDPPAGQTPNSDLCVLRFEYDGDTNHAILGASVDLSNPPNQEFRTGGYPAGWTVDFANGLVVGKDSNGLYMLRPDAGSQAIYGTAIKDGFFATEQRPAGLIHEGFSGSPVEVDGVIVGLLASARSRIGDATAFMIPVSAFPNSVVRPAISIPPQLSKLSDPRVLRELLGGGSEAGAPSLVSEGTSNVFRYFLEHKCVYENTDSVESLVQNLRASPELHLLGPDKIKGAVVELKNLGLVIHKQDTLSFGAPSTIAKWTLAEPRIFTSRVPSLRYEIEEFHRRADQDRPIVMHDGLAKLGGTNDIVDSLDRVGLGYRIRWLTYHGLSDHFRKSIQDLGTRRSLFDLRVLMCASDAHKELQEGAPLKSHQTAVEEGRKKLYALAEVLRAESENISLDVRVYRELREGYVRGLLVTDADDQPVKLSLISWRWPHGRGTEGERLVMRSSDEGICSIAYWFRDHFDNIWDKNPAASEDHHATT